MVGWCTLCGSFQGYGLVWLVGRMNLFLHSRIYLAEAGTFKSIPLFFYLSVRSLDMTDILLTGTLRLKSNQKYNGIAS